MGVTGWHQNIDDLAAAVADLLTDSSVGTSPLTDTAAVLACRDALVVQVRQLVGSLADMPPVSEVRPLRLLDVINRPAQALQQALAQLPRAGEFGQVDVNSYFVTGLPPYEQRWREAGRAALSLEIYVEPLRHIPDRNSWPALRDLTDLAAALPALDHDLAEAILPRLKAAEDLRTPYEMLTHPGHDAVRICATEIRSRVPAVPAATTPAPPVPDAVRGGELDKAMDRYIRTVLNRGADLSIGDMRAVSRLLQFGGEQMAVVLERAQHAVPGAGDAAKALREMAPLAERLRMSAAKTVGSESLEMLRGSGELLARLRALTVQERSLPGGASDRDLRRLAAPALEYAMHVPALAQALELGVRDALANGSMLVPRLSDDRNASKLLWVPAGARGRGSHGPPAVRQHASAVAQAAEGVAPAVRTALAALSSVAARNSAPSPTEGVHATSEAAAQARRYAGGARAQLREILNRQTSHVPPPLSFPLPTHPRLAPDGPVSDRRR
jgi:hypothetical protein